MKIGSKLLISHLSMMILPIILLGIILILLVSSSIDELDVIAHDEGVVVLTEEAGKIMEKSTFSLLSTARVIKQNQIENYFKERFGDLKVLAQSQDVLNAFNAFKAYMDEIATKANESLDITTEKYKALWKEYSVFFSEYLKEYGYYDLFIITAENGHVLYTVAKEADLGANLRQGKYKTSGLAIAWKKAIQDDKAVIDDFKPYEPSNDEPASFICSPIRDKVGTTIGVLGLQIPINGIDEIMQERTGMGKTGETYLVGSDNLMRSDSYLDPINHSVIASFANPKKGSVRTEATKAGLAGEDGEKIIDDYRGEKVLSSYGPVKIQDVNWAIIAEIDKAEAFEAKKTFEGHSDEIGKHMEDANESAINTIIMFIISIVIGFGIVGFIITLFIARTMTRPIIRTVNLAEAIKDGDLTQELDVKQKDEIGQLAETLKVMTENLNELITQVDESSDQVASGSGQVSASSQSLSQGASEQAASLEEVTSSMQEIGSQTKTNAENATQANQLADNARDSAEKGNEQVKSMVGAMGEISESSKEIAKIIKVIDDIAFQTNLLALNAAVEAARAGRYGKGFAVVAEEVRNLAARSAKAAKETSELIEGAIKRVDNGTEIANKTAEALGEIVEGASKVSDLVNEIAAASNEQAQGVSQVNQGLGQIEQVTQTNTANAEETAAASEELSAQALNLKQLLQRFKLKGNGARREKVQPVLGVDYHMGTATPVMQQAAPGMQSGNGDGAGQQQAFQVAPIQQQATKVVQPNEVIKLDGDEFGKY